MQQLAMYCSGSILILSVIYFPLFLYVANIMQCTTDPITGLKYLLNYPAISCDFIHPVSKAFILIAWTLSIGSIFFGLPLYLQRNFNAQSHPFIIQLFGSHYLIYKNGTKGETNCMYAGAILFLRKFLLALIVAVIPPTNIFNPLLILTVISLHFWFFFSIRTYRWSEGNSLSLFSQFILILIFACVMADTPYQFEDPYEAGSVIFYGLLSVIFCGCIVSKIYSNNYINTKSTEPPSSHAVMLSERSSEIQELGP